MPFPQQPRLGPDRQPIVRIVCLASLLRNGQLRSLGEVAARFEVSLKTIARDLELLRDQLGFDCEYDGSARRWILKQAPRAVLI
ncbi:MAG TPA: hypothetical protein VK163_06145 [Opitutaceae bacterium]|nr:hypothetical protein [Opitutaceae bacterium]